MDDHDGEVELSDPPTFLPNTTSSDHNNNNSQIKSRWGDSDVTALPLRRLVPNTTSSDHSNNNTLKGSASAESITDEFFKHTQTCTHTHTCNPPEGPDATAHTHTCFHTHTQVFSSGGEDTKTISGDSCLRPRKALGNREAVRKYREKKKAHSAYLEEEVKKLRVLNQQLVRKLQGQAALEAELLRLRGLFVELGGKIDVELGSFPFLKHCGSNPSVSFREGDCEGQILCFHSIGNGSMAPVGSCEGVEKAAFSWGGNCEPAIVDCSGNGNGSDHQFDGMETVVSTKNRGQ